MKLTKIQIPVKGNKIHEWSLDPRVNIIGGTNGSYKTNILKSIHNNVQAIKSNKQIDSQYQMEFDSSNIPDSLYLSPSVPLFNLMELIFKFKVNKSSTTLDILIQEEISKFDPSESENFLTVLHDFMPTYIPDVNIHIQELSYCERYLMYLLLATANTTDKPTILLLDNVGGYLQPNWQSILLKELLILNPNLQIIIGTQIQTIIDGAKHHIKNTNILILNEYIPKYQE